MNSSSVKFIRVQIGIRNPICKSFMYYPKGLVYTKDKAIQQAIEYIWSLLGNNCNPWAFILENVSDEKVKEKQFASY